MKIKRNLTMEGESYANDPHYKLRHYMGNDFWTEFEWFAIDHDGDILNFMDEPFLHSMVDCWVDSEQSTSFAHIIGGVGGQYDDWKETCQRVVVENTVKYENYELADRIRLLEIDLDEKSHRLHKELLEEYSDELERIGYRRMTDSAFAEERMSQTHCADERRDIECKSLIQYTVSVQKENALRGRLSEMVIDELKPFSDEIDTLREQL